MKLFDELLLVLVRRRLARFKLHDDAAKQFSDGLLSAIGSELARRSTLAGDFDQQALDESVARAKAQLVAVIEFEELDVQSANHVQ